MYHSAPPCPAMDVFYRKILGTKIDLEMIDNLDTLITVEGMYNVAKQAIL